MSVTVVAAWIDAAVGDGVLREEAVLQARTGLPDPRGPVLAAQLVVPAVPGQPPHPPGVGAEEGPLDGRLMAGSAPAAAFPALDGSEELAEAVEEELEELEDPFRYPFFTATKHSCRVMKPSWFVSK